LLCIIVKSDERSVFSPLSVGSAAIFVAYSTVTTYFHRLTSKGMGTIGISQKAPVTMLGRVLTASSATCFIAGLTLCLLVCMATSANAQQRAGFSGDSDNDGVADVDDADDDNDTIPDDVEGTVDTDGDGIIDCLDLDSDNDGISDLYEVIAGTSLQPLIDADKNGVLDAGVSVGSNGLVDVAEQGVESAISITSIVDLDGDGIRDQQDLDSDNDGIPDVSEAGSSDSDFDGKYDFFLDLNGDGMADRLTATPIIPRDTDLDGVDDYRDLDSDNDGLSDRLETSNTDTDGDGMVDGFVDVNIDGLHDPYNTEFDGVPDTDRDGFPDYRDTDSDGDGVSDAEEGFSSTVDSELVVPSTPFNPSLVEPKPALTLETGENGNVLGCSLTTASHPSKTVDAAFLLMLFVAFLVMFKQFVMRKSFANRKRYSQRLSQPRAGQPRNSQLRDGKPKPSAQTSLTTLLAMTVLSGCAAQSNGNPAAGLSTLGPYAGVGLGASFLNVNTSDTTLEQNQDFSAAGQVTLGVDMGPTLALELRAADLGEATFDTGEALGYQVADASALAKARFNKLTAFGRVGVGALFNDGDFDTKQKNKTHLVIGAGAEYTLSRQLSVRSEWQGHDVDVMHGQLSLLYRFGARNQRPRVIVASQRQEAEEFQPVPVKPPVVPEPEPEPEQPIASQADDRVSDSRALSSLDIQKLPENSAVQTPPAPPSPTQNQTKSPDTQIARAEIPSPPNPPATADSNSLKPLITVPEEPVAAPPLAEESKKIAVSRPDSDEDGIDDASDNCPGSQAGEPVLANGCSMFGESVPGLTFFPDTDRLTKSAEQVLDTVAQAMLDDASVGVTVAAHTRPSTDANVAMFLTRRRTIAIIRYLSEQGIDATRLRPEAYGDTQPLASAVEPSDNDRVVLSER